MNRRRFLQSLGLATVATSFTAPTFAEQTSITASRRKKYLVLIELKGGNDGLNTVVPYSDPLYKQLRPTIAISADQILPLNTELGLHPSLRTVKRLFDKGDVSIIQSVGYDQPNLSHFNSIDIWESASRPIDGSGWLYKLLQNNPTNAGLVDGVVLGGSSGFFQGEKSKFLSMKSTAEFIRSSKKLTLSQSLPANDNAILAHLNRNKTTVLETSKVLAKALNIASPINVTFPDTDIGEQFESAAQIINAGFDTPVIKVSLKGFDTHVEQQEAHTQLLSELDNALHSFEKAMQAQGLWRDVLLMSYSEFGRRARENGNTGTDHGAASCQFIIGSQCQGGLYGEAANLRSLQNDNVVHSIDFRQLYATIERRWFGVSNGVVDRKVYPEIGFLKG